MRQYNSLCNTAEEIVPVRMKEEIKVSVILPVYNSEEYLDEAIQSVVGQTLEEIEILCMDDGSTDGSFSILKDWAETDRRIGIYQQKNAGPSVARNQLLDHAHGQYILYLDSDDVLASDALENLFRTAENENLDLLIYNGSNFYDEDLPVGARRVREGRFIIEDYRGICSGPEMLVKLQEHKDLYSTAGLFLISRLFLEREAVRFHEGILHEDTAYTFELLLKANRVDYLKTAFYKRRLRKNSITTGIKRFDHCYGTYLGYLDMCNVFRQREKQLTGREKGAARYRIQWMLNAARERYMQMPENFAGEEYGLHEDFTDFHSLIGSYCEQLSLQKNANEKLTAATRQLNIFRISIKETKDKLDHTEMQLLENKSKLGHTESQLQETKGKLNRTESQLQETKDKLDHTEMQLQETKNKLDYTELQLLENKSKLDQTEIQLYEMKGELRNTESRLQETENHLCSTANRLEGALEEISCLKNSVSFRLGRGLTWPLRKLRDLFRLSN